MPEEAMAIYQDFLDRTSDALVSGDAEGFLRHVHLPHQIVTDNGIIEVADMTAALKHFEGFFGALRAAGADSYVRTAIGRIHRARPDSRAAYRAYHRERQAGYPCLRE